MHSYVFRRRGAVDYPIIKRTALVSVQIGTTISRAIKNPARLTSCRVCFWCLAMSYSHMGKPHTTIGEDTFHC